MTTTQNAKLTGITAGAGQCDCCGRAITVRRFQVRYTDGTEATLGRACCAKATGYAAARMDREAEATRRLDAKAAEDRANGVTLEQMIQRQMTCGEYPAAVRRAEAWFAFVYPEAVAA